MNEPATLHNSIWGLVEDSGHLGLGTDPFWNSAVQSTTVLSHLSPANRGIGLDLGTEIWLHVLGELLYTSSFCQGFLIR